MHKNTVNNSNNLELSLSKKISFSLILIIIFIGLAELVLRFLGFAPEPNFYNYSKTLHHTLKPNYEQVYAKDILYRTNSLGLRDDEFTREKPADEFRILCLGDSLTWGQSMRLQDTYPQELEWMLNTAGKGGKKYQVINSGVPGWNTEHEQVYLKEQGLALQPDIVVLGFCLNDFEGPSLEKTLQQIPKSFLHLWAKEFLRYSAIYNFTAIIYRQAMLVRDYPRKPAPQLFLYSKFKYNIVEKKQKKSWARISQALLDINQLCKENNIPFIVSIFPYYAQITEPENNFLQKKLITLCNQENIAYIDLLEEFKHYSPRYLYLDHCHLTAFGYQLTAEKILLELISENLLPEKISAPWLPSPVRE